MTFRGTHPPSMCPRPSVCPGGQYSSLLDGRRTGRQQTATTQPRAAQGPAGGRTSGASACGCIGHSAARRPEGAALNQEGTLNTRCGLDSRSQRSRPCPPGRPLVTRPLHVPTSSGAPPPSPYVAPVAGEHGAWRTFGEQIIYDNRWLRLGLVDVEAPNGERWDYHVVHLARIAIALIVN